MIQVICFSCQKATPVTSTVGLRDECSQCHADLHVCKNCKHYDANSYNECREPVAERVREKERSNFCDQFTPGSGTTQSKTATEDLLSAAEKLFKKG